MKRLDGPDGAKTFAGVLTDPTVQFFDLFLIEPRVGFCKGHQFRIFPKRESVIGKQVGSSSASRLGIDQDCIKGQRIDFVFPPMPTFSSGKIGTLLFFQHQPLGTEIPRTVSKNFQGFLGIGTKAGRNFETGLITILDEDFQNLSSFFQGMLSQILTIGFKTVIGQKNTGVTFQKFGTDLLPAQTFLKKRKRQRLIFIPA